MTEPRTTEPMFEGWSPPPASPSPRLGWTLLAFVVIVVGLAGWWVVETLEGRAPAARERAGRQGP